MRTDMGTESLRNDSEVTNPSGVMRTGMRTESLRNNSEVTNPSGVMRTGMRTGSLRNNSEVTNVGTGPSKTVCEKKKKVFESAQVNIRPSHASQTGMDEPCTKKPKFGPPRKPEPVAKSRPFESLEPLTVLEDISQEQRARKAVKADNAAVAEYIWEGHLLEDVGGVDWDAITLQKVRKLSEWL
jgi:hypothetical protein